MSAHHKLAAPLLLRALQSPKAHDPRLDLLVSLRQQLTSGHRDSIERLGGRVRTTAGTVVTIDLALSALTALTELDVVQFVDLSAPLYDESTDGKADES